jgi:hypothetical protein
VTANEEAKLLGEASCNLADYGEGDFHVHRLILKGRFFKEDPVLEVGIKGVPYADPKSQQQPAPTQ